MDQQSMFWEYMMKEMDNLENIPVSTVIQEAGGAQHVHLVVVDILKGFCETGALSSKRVSEVIEPVKNLADSLLEKGMPTRNLLFLQDDHPVDAPEFASFPPHCVRGTEEAEIVEPLRPLLETQGAELYTKNATSGLFAVNQNNRRFFDELEERMKDEAATFLVVGDCTDLCIYQNAMGIRMLANEKNHKNVRVMVSKTHTQTYHLSVEDSRSSGAMAHDGDVMDTVFFYHMKLNGIEVYRNWV